MDRQQISWIAARLRERSTYAGLIVVVSFVLPYLAKYIPVLAQANAQDIVNDIAWIGMGVGGLIAIAIPDKSKAIAVLLALGLSTSMFSPMPAAAQPKATTTTSTTSGPCSFNIFSGLTAQNFISQLRQCSAKDAQAALDDATKQSDQVAIACLSLVAPIVEALGSSDGNTGVLTAFQKFRDFKRGGGIGNCTSYVNTTIMLQ